MNAYIVDTDLEYPGERVALIADYRTPKYRIHQNRGPFFLAVLECGISIWCLGEDVVIRPETFDEYEQRMDDAFSEHLDWVQSVHIEP